MNKCRVIVFWLLPGVLLISVFLGMGVMASQAEPTTATFGDIPMYRVLCKAGDVDLDTLAAKCAGRPLVLNKTDDGRLATDWDIDYRSALRTDELMRRLGAATEVDVQGFAYQNLLKEGKIDKQKFATFTDLMTPPEQDASITSEAVYNEFTAVSAKEGVSRKDRIAALAKYVDQLRFRSGDAYAQYLVAMFHYMTGQELQDTYDQTLLEYYYLPLSADVNRHYLTAYMHIDACSQIAGPLHEDAAFERAMIAYYARKQGDEVFRIKQCITELNKSIEAFPNGRHSFRLSLHRLEITKDMMGIRTLSPVSKEFYKAELVNKAEAVIKDPRVIPDPKSYEQMLAVILYSESMYFLQKYQSITDYYQSKLGQIEQSKLPESTYWMFANLWNTTMSAAELNNDWNTALRFAEMRLATPPGQGNAWPNGSPKENKLSILRKAALYSKNLGNTDKENSFNQQADSLEKELKIK